MTKITAVFCSIILLAIIGCESAQQKTPTEANNLLNNYSDFAPAKIKIISLTEFTDDSNLKIYVDLVDSFGSRIKSPAVFRFELYEYVERSAEPKGRRIFLWPDIDLTPAKANNDYWQDFLRAYEFNMDLDFELEDGKTYILQTFCRTPPGKRLTATKRLTFTNN